MYILGLLPTRTLIRGLGHSLVSFSFSRACPGQAVSGELNENDTSSSMSSIGTRQPSPVGNDIMDRHVSAL